MLEVNSKAPNFTLPDINGNNHSLTDYLGKKVVIYFYPKDNTSGCTKQALMYKELYDSFVSKDIVCIGISKDSIKSHKSFTTKYSLPFLLLSDVDLIAIKDYDVWHEKKLYGKTYMGVVRTTYIIDENGFIISANEKVSPESDAHNTLCLINKIYK